MASGWPVARLARARQARRAIGSLAIFTGAALWVVAALLLRAPNAAIGVVIGGALVAAGVVLILSSI
jgi:hypothetical protein